MVNRGGYYKRTKLVNVPITSGEYELLEKSNSYKKLYKSDLDIDYTTQSKEYKNRWWKPIVNRGVRVVNGNLEEIINEVDDE